MVIFTKHALLKLRQRRIPRVSVERTLRKPDFVRASTRERRIAYKKFRRLYLKVIYAEERGQMIVITQYWDEELTLSRL